MLRAERQGCLLSCLLLLAVGGCGGVVSPDAHAVADVRVAPSAATLTIGATRALTVTVKDAQGNVLQDRPVVWTTENNTLVGISQDGIATGKATGRASVAANVEGTSGVATLTVIVPPVASVAVAPSPTSVEAGSTRQLTTTLRDAGGAVLSGRAIAWASSNNGIATVSASGLVTGNAAGTASITATSEGQSGSATVTVTLPPVASVTVSPQAITMRVGDLKRIDIVLRDARGNELSDRQVTWTSSDDKRATVSQLGQIFALLPGTVTITATSEGKSDTVVVTVRF